MPLATGCDGPACGQHKPPAILPLDRVDATDAGKNPADADVIDPAVAALDERTAVLHTVDGPILQDMIRKLRRVVRLRRTG